MIGIVILSAMFIIGAIVLVLYTIAGACFLAQAAWHLITHTKWFHKYINSEYTFTIDFDKIPLSSIINIIS